MPWRSAMAAPAWCGPHSVNTQIPAQLALKDAKMEPHSAAAEPVECACGKPLRDPVSRARGLGPVCWRKLHGRTHRRPRVVSPTAAPGPGQDELPLADQLDLFT